MHALVPLRCHDASYNYEKAVANSIARQEKADQYVQTRLRSEAGVEVENGLLLGNKSLQFHSEAWNLTPNGIRYADSSIKHALSYFAWPDPRMTAKSIYLRERQLLHMLSVFFPGNLFMRPPVVTLVSPKGCACRFLLLLSAIKNTNHRRLAPLGVLSQHGGLVLGLLLVCSCSLSFLEQGDCFSYEV